MFGIIHRGIKEGRAFLVLNNGAKENLLPIIKNNIEYGENKGKKKNFQRRIV